MERTQESKQVEKQGGYGISSRARQTLAYGLRYTLDELIDEALCSYGSTVGTPDSEVQWQLCWAKIDGAMAIYHQAMKLLGQIEVNH